MRGIVFCGGEGPPAAVARRLVDVAGSGALVAAADSGLIAAEAAGIRPHWIIGDMDSLDDQARLAKYPAEAVMRYAAAKDYTDTELALSLLWEKGCTELWIAGGGGGRLDHLFALRALCERERFPARWVTAADDVRCISGVSSANAAGGAAENTVEAVVDSGAPVSVFPLADGPWAAYSTGLHWPLAGVRWERGLFGVSNIAGSGVVRITAERGRFMVILPLAAVYGGGFDAGSGN